MEKLPLIQIRSMVRHGFSGLEKLIVPGLFIAIISFIGLKPGSTRDIALRIGIALPFIGFLWGLRIYEYSERFALWKDYLTGKASLAEAFTGIANRRIWVYMIPAAYFCGIVIGIIFYFLVPFAQGFGRVHFARFSPVTYLLGVPAFTVLLLFGANIFGPKPDEEEELTFDVLGILNKSPQISPQEIESEAAVERFVNGATSEKNSDMKPYLWILSHICPLHAMAVFGTALKNNDSHIRKMAATYFSRVGGSDALQLLQEHLSDETDPEIKKLIGEKIAQVSGRKNI